MTKEIRQSIEYNGKLYRLPFNIPSGFLNTNQVIAEDKDTDITENERSKKFTV